MSTNIHLRGVDDQMFKYLKRSAVEKKISVNKLILNLLKQSLGIGLKPKQQTYHDLDALAGGWSSKEAKEFLHHISDFENIDEELWK